MKNIYFILFLLFSAAFSFFFGQLPHPGNYIWVFSVLCIVLTLVIIFDEGVNFQGISSSIKAEVQQLESTLMARIKRPVNAFYEAPPKPADTPTSSPTDQQGAATTNFSSFKNQL